MDDDIDNVAHKPTYEELLRVVNYIARYKSWDFQKVREPWKWCNEFTHVASATLKGEETFCG
jgi:hypothetical protein